MSNGFYLMHRGWMDNHIFKPTVYTEQMAWQWLIENASFMPSKMRHKNTLVSLERGDVPASYRKLQEAWKWGVHRVRGFLALLEKEGMITRKIETGFLIIKINAYDEYQQPSETQTATPAATVTATQTATNINKGKQRKTKKKGTCEGAVPEPEISAKEKKPKPEPAWPDSDPDNVEAYERCGNGFKLKASWCCPNEWFDWVRSEFGWDEARTLLESEKFRDYWCSSEAKKPIKTDWFMTWKNWCRTTNGVKNYGN